MPVPLLVVLCGLSFSGKSTLAVDLAQRLPGEVVGFDAINAERGLLGGQGIPIEEWITTKQLAHERARALLASGATVIVDDTGSPRFLRDEWRALGEEPGARTVIVHVEVDPQVQRSRVRATRERGDRPDVIDPVLEEHRAGFEPPGEDEAPLRIDGRATRDDSAVTALVDRIRQP